MLSILWRSFDQSHHSALKALMVKFGLMVPLPINASQDAPNSPLSPSLSSAVPFASTSVFKVPALLPDQPLPRTGFVARSCFFFFFSLDPHDGHADKTAMDKKGFLPDGLFSRILGECLILSFTAFARTNDRLSLVLSGALLLQARATKPAWPLSRRGCLQCFI